MSRAAAKKIYLAEGSVPADCSDALLDLRSYLDEPLLLCRFGKYAKENGYERILLCWADIQEFRSLIESDYRSTQLCCIFDQYFAHISAGSSAATVELPTLGIHLPTPYVEQVKILVHDTKCLALTQDHNNIVSVNSGLTGHSFNAMGSGSGAHSHNGSAPNSIALPEMDTAEVADPPTVDHSRVYDKLQQACLQMLNDSVFSKFKQSLMYYASLKEMKNQYNRVVVDDFEFMEKLGQGAYGFVVHCRKKSTGRDYAMKIQTKVGMLDCFADCPERVVYEKDAIASCNHPFIVGMDYAFQTSTLTFMVTTLGTGGTLADAAICCPNNKMSLERVRFYSAEIVLALAHIHRMGLIYRDLKPANVLLNADGHIQLVDLGGIVDVSGKVLGQHAAGTDATVSTSLFAIDYEANRPGEASVSMSTSAWNAQIRGDRSGAISTTGLGPTIRPQYRLNGEKTAAVTQRAKSIMGTVGYMAPEMLAMLQNDSLTGYTAAVDYWSLGVTMYKLLSGSLPFHESHVNMFYDFLQASLASPLPEDIEGVDMRAHTQTRHPAYIAFERRLRSDPRMTEDTVDIIVRLLEVNEKKRLGFGKKGYRSVKHHPFFRGFQWGLLPTKQVAPPYVVGSDFGCSGIDEMPFCASSDSAELDPTVEQCPVLNFNDMMEGFGKESWLLHAPRGQEQQYFETWDFVSPQILKLEMGLHEEKRMADNIASSGSSNSRTSATSFVSTQLNRISVLLHMTPTEASQPPSDSSATEDLANVGSGGQHESLLVTQSGVGMPKLGSAPQSAEKSHAELLNKLFSVDRVPA